MSEKKARELLKAYMDAELAGEDEKAASIEEQLKNAGWHITVGPEGTTVQKRQKDKGALGELFLPKESTTPYSGSGTDSGSGNSTKTLLITIGISAALIGLIVLIVFLVKRSKNAGLQQG